VRFPAPGSGAGDCAAAALVVGSTLALWAAFLAAVW